MIFDFQIDDVLSSAVSSALTEEKLKPLVEKAVGEAVTSVIRDQFAYSSDFRKELETQISAVMPKTF